MEADLKIQRFKIHQELESLHFLNLAIKISFFLVIIFFILALSLQDSSFFQKSLLFEIIGSLTIFGSLTVLFIFVKRHLTKEVQSVAKNTSSFFKSVVNCFDNPIFIVNSNHRCVFVNDAYCKLIGLNDSKLKEENLLQLLKNIQIEDEVLREKEVLESGIPNESEGLFTPPFGKVQRIHIKRRLIIDEKKQKFIVSTLTNITEKTDIELKNKEAQAQLFHSSKLESLGRLAAGIAHEIKNPLAIMSGYVEILAECCPDHKDIVDKQYESISKISSIVTALTSYARSNTEEISHVDFHKAISSTISLCDCIFRRSDTYITCSLKSKNPVVCGNSGKLQQVIMNLVSNAKDSMEDLKYKHITISTYDKENNFVMEIQDRGCGIPEKNLDKIFEAFYTTKAEGKGTGLGLSICWSIISSLGGKIEVESTTGNGSTFRVILPAVSA